MNLTKLDAVWREEDETFISQKKAPKEISKLRILIFSSTLLVYKIWLENYLKNRFQMINVNLSEYNCWKNASMP